MIKKNTKVIFKIGEEVREEDWRGGVPLAVGETVHFHGDNPEDILQYEVKEKKTDVFKQGEDQIVNIVYTLKLK